MLSGVAAAAAISVSLARQRPVVPPTINERRVRCDGVMSIVLFAGVNPQTDYPGGGLSTKDKAPAIGHIWAFHAIRALTRLPPQMTTRYLGAPIARNEDRRLLTGRAVCERCRTTGDAACRLPTQPPRPCQAGYGRSLAGPGAAGRGCRLRRR